MTIFNCDVEFRRVYGNKLYYPLNDKAKGFTVLLKCKTLTAVQLKHINDIGVNVNVFYDINGNMVLDADGAHYKDIV